VTGGATGHHYYQDHNTAMALFNHRNSHILTRKTSIDDHDNHFYSVLNSKNDWVVNNATNIEATTADG